MRRDPFDPPAAALTRPPGHLRSSPRSKKAGLTPYLGATGVPLGGIGTGGITRGCEGRVGRWTLKAGAVALFDMPACGAVLRVAPEGRAPEARALQPAPRSGELAAFAFEAEAPAWAGLFPFAWHTHAPVGGVRAKSLSFSPVIPGDVATAALPVAVMRWRLTNEGARPAEATIAVHWPNLNGWFDRPEEGRPGRVAGGCFNRGGRAPGTVVLDRRRPEGVPPEGTGTWALAIGGAGAALSRTLAFDGAGDGAAFWEGVLESGDTPDLGPSWLTESGFRETAPPHPAAAVSARVRLAPGETREVTAALAWNLPALTFGSGRRWLRAHADAWGREGRAAEALAAHALAEADGWIARLQDWQAETIAALGDAPEGAGLALNELYFVVDGLSVLTSAERAPDLRRHFGLIECPDYALYDTMDLWVYAAEAVGRHWPELAAAVAEDYADHLLADDPAPRRHRWNGTPFMLNPAGISPHDLGGP
ncbi:MAG: hypothetical protein GVY27_13120, partial [Deinococcus-Thermus bacterium]|nr:hypothetical protein [Deinococcota bacterium]